MGSMLCMHPLSLGKASPKKLQSQGGRGHGPQWPGFWRQDGVLQENSAKTMCFLQIKLYCHFQKAGKAVAPICNPLKLLISLQRCIIIPMVFSSYPTPDLKMESEALCPCRPLPPSAAAWGGIQGAASSPAVCSAKCTQTYQKRRRY